MKDVYAPCLYITRCIIHLGLKYKARSTNILIDFNMSQKLKMHI